MCTVGPSYLKYYVHVRAHSCTPALCAERLMYSGELAYACIYRYIYSEWVLEEASYNLY